MSGIVRPKGGASAGVYWRRRLILLAVVLLIAAGVVRLLGSDGGDDGDSVADTQNTQPTPDQASGDDDEPQERKRRRLDRDDSDATAGQRNVAVRLGDRGACDPAAVTITPGLAPDSHAAGEVAVRLAISTSEDRPCILSLEEHTPLISISDGSEVVWESTRCSDLFATDRVRLEPGWLSYVDARWSGRASGRTCGDSADYTDAGEYEVRVAVLGGEPSSATVSLESAPKTDDEADKPDREQEKADKPEQGKADKPDQKRDESADRGSSGDTH